MVRQGKGKIIKLGIMKSKPATVTEYINAAPKETRAKLREMRSIIRAAAPGATENIKYGMPAYSYKRILVCFAVFKHHIGFFPGPSVIKAFANDLTKYKTSKATLQLPLEKPIPVSLVKKLTAFRVMEDEMEGAKRKQ
jgi:uncharacterized protein YdhG (YjbR/CyaY superfamily)